MQETKSKALTTRLLVGFGLGGIFLVSLIQPVLFVLLTSVAGALGPAFTGDGSTAGFADFIQAEITRYADVIRRAHITAET